MTPDNKNLYLAIALSILVIIGWNYFYGAPQMERARQTQAQLQQPATPPQPKQPGSPNASEPQSPLTTQPGGVVPETPQALEAVCLKALEKKSADRYASAKALAQDVERWLARLRTRPGFQAHIDQPLS